MDSEGKKYTPNYLRGLPNLLAAQIPLHYPVVLGQNRLPKKNRLPKNLHVRFSPAGARLAPVRPHPVVAGLRPHRRRRPRPVAGPPICRIGRSSAGAGLPPPRPPLSSAGSGSRRSVLPRRIPPAALSIAGREAPRRPVQRRPRPRQPLAPVPCTAAADASRAPHRRVLVASPTPTLAAFHPP